MKILLGVDTSPHAGETLSFLCSLPCPRGSSVTVLSVVGQTEPHVAPTPQLLASVAQKLGVIESRQVEVHEELVARTETRLREAGFTVSSEILNGDARHALVAAARTHDVDLLVIGSHGHSGVGKLMMGSVASYVVAHAECNVLVVRRGATPPR